MELSLAGHSCAIRNPGIKNDVIKSDINTTVLARTALSRLVQAIDGALESNCRLIQADEMDRGFIWRRRQDVRSYCSTPGGIVAVLSCSVDAP